jgi:hypothetical protein
MKNNKKDIINQLQEVQKQGEPNLFNDVSSAVKKQGKQTGLSVYQYSRTNVIHFLFSLLRINGLYMFQALLAHLQEALHKRNFVYCVRVISVGCTRIGVFHAIYQMPFV